MTNEDLVAIIKSHRDDSLGAEDGDLSNQRAEAMDHYHGRPYGNEMVGRSQVVDRSLAETVDWALPSILRTFVQSGDIGAFDPVGPEDEPLAQQESDYVNQVIMKDNPGFMILHDAIKDTLLLKNGYVKHYWDEYYKVNEEEYEGLTAEQLVQMLTQFESSGAEVAIKGQEVRQTEAGELYDVKLQIKRNQSKCCVEAVPSEEVRVSKRCRGSLQDSPFTEHVTLKTRSALLEMGLPRRFVDDLPAQNQRYNDTQAQSRDSVDNESESYGTSINDRSQDEIEFCEAYIRVDYDGDGVAELRKVVTCADRIPPGEEWNRPIEAVPITGFVMKRVPHRHVGESLDDELKDLQEILTTLKRQLNDNVYLANNNRWLANADYVNLRDLMTVTPGGIIRGNGDRPLGDILQAVQTPNILPDLLPAIDFYNKAKEVRTGIRPGSDMDPDMLKEITKGAFLEHLNRASQKIEMMTRLLAETGVKELFLQVHGILTRHQNQARMVQLRGKWVAINPQEWKERTDLTVRVGLGTGNEEEKRQKLAMLAQFQGQLLQMAGMAPPPVYAKAYALFEDLSKAMGFDIPEKYAVAPSSPEFQMLAQMAQQKMNQPPPEVLKVQMQGQIEQAKMQMQQETDRNRQAMEAQEQAARIEMEKQLAQFKAQLDMQLEEQRMRIKAETDIIIARINAQAQLDSAQLTAQTTLSAEQEAASDAATSD